MGIEQCISKPNEFEQVRSMPEPLFVVLSDTDAHRPYIVNLAQKLGPKNEDGFVMTNAVLEEGIPGNRQKDHIYQVSYREDALPQIDEQKSVKTVRGIFRIYAGEGVVFEDATVLYNDGSEDTGFAFCPIFRVGDRIFDTETGISSVIGFAPSISLPKLQ